MELEFVDHPFGPLYNTCPNKAGRYGKCIAVQLTGDGWRFQLVEVGMLATEWTPLGECPIPGLTRDNEAIWAVSVAAFAHPSFGQTRED